MTETALVIRSSAPLPALVTGAGERASVRFLEFFAAAIRNPHTRRAYARAVGAFLNWCADRRGGIDHGRAATACRHLDRAADA
jgi:hypothetical protein